MSVQATLKRLQLAKREDFKASQINNLPRFARAHAVSAKMPLMPATPMDLRTEPSLSTDPSASLKHSRKRTKENQRRNHLARLKRKVFASRTIKTEDSDKDLNVLMLKCAQHSELQSHLDKVVVTTSQRSVQLDSQKLHLPHQPSLLVAVDTFKDQE